MSASVRPASASASASSFVRAAAAAAAAAAASLLPAASPRHVGAVSEQAHARVDELMADLDLMMACYE